MKTLLLALQFLTRLPVPSSPEAPSARLQGQAVLWYPLVGLLLGGFLVLLAWLFTNTAPLLQAAIILLCWIALTGALHLDGLADLADAWIGGQGDRQHTLEIMKDSRCGPMAVVALICLLLLKLTALAQLLEQGAAGWIWLLPLLGRAGLVAALLWVPYARPEGLGAVAAANLPRSSAGIVIALSALLTALIGPPGLMVLLVAAVLFLLLRRAFLNRLGGVTGDAAGALCELLETAALVTLALLA